MNAAAAVPVKWPGGLFVYDCVDSTNALAADMLARNGTGEFAVVAGEQTAGRGRLGRSWASPADLGMYCSVVFRPDAPVMRYPQLTLTAAVAAVEAVEALHGGRLSIKWPNDLFHGDRKVGGILSEIVPDPAGGREYAIVGIGVNVLRGGRDYRDDLAGRASSLFEMNGKAIAPIALAGAFLDAFHGWRVVWERDGFDGVRDRWLRYDRTVGKTVSIGESPGVKALVTGIDASGCLSVRDDMGRSRSVVAGDITLLA